MSSISHKWERDKIESQKVSYDELEKIIAKDLAGGPAKSISKLPAPEGWDQTDSVLIECEGWWKLHSNSDRRWRATGKAIVGGKQMCKEARAMFFRLKENFGNPPFDLIYVFEPLNLKKFRLAGDDKKQL